MPLTHDLPNFALTEFQHPELIDERAALYLQTVRTLYAAPIRVTNDGRTKAENAAIPESAPESLHLKGQAFDLKLPGDAWRLWMFVSAVAIARPRNMSVELGIYTGKNAHVHLGVAWDGRPSKLYLKNDNHSLLVASDTTRSV